MCRPAASSRARGLTVRRARPRPPFSGNHRPKRPKSSWDHTTLGTTQERYVSGDKILRQALDDLPQPEAFVSCFGVCMSRAGVFLLPRLRFAARHACPGHSRLGPALAAAFAASAGARAGRRRAGSREWDEIPPIYGYTDNSRGLGVADMAYSLLSGLAHRANGDLTYHVLDIMHAIHDASRDGRHIELESTCERPAPLPLGLLDGRLDE